jgi:hypothetical protein
MKAHVHKRAELGDLVVAAYDEAARWSSDPREVSRLANKVVLHLLHAVPSRPRIVRPRPKSAKLVS